MTHDNGTIAQRLGEYLVGLEYRDLPPEVVQKTKEALLDQLGCQIVGSTLSWNRIIYDFITSFRGPGEATIINFGTKALAHDAAFVNGTFGQGAELDDHFDFGGGHHGSICVPIALALGEKERLDGEAVVTAIVAGYEAAGLLAKAMMPHIIQRGFHPQSVIGVFAACAVAGKLLKLDASQMAHALAIAGSHACGTMEYDQSGGEVKRMHTGLAIRGGIHAAIVARMGLTGPLTIFEGKRGILPLFSGQDGSRVVTSELGRDFSILHLTFKTHPTMGLIQSPISVLTDLMRENDFEARDVEHIDVGLTETALLHGAGISEPKDAIGAQFSLAFSLAIRLLRGSNDISLYIDPNLWRDPEVLALARKVRAYADPDFSWEGKRHHASRVRVTLADGRVLEKVMDYPKGSPGNPLSKAELEEKFRHLGSRALKGGRLDEIISTVNRVGGLADVAELTKLLVGTRQAP